MKRNWRVAIVSQHNEPTRYLKWDGKKTESQADAGTWSEDRAKEIARSLQDHHDEFVVAETLP